MKALSLRQPWAWLVVHGGKVIENRTWSTRFRGGFYVHAAKGMTVAEYKAAHDFALLTDRNVHLPGFDELARGGIIGRARLVDVIEPCSNVSWPLCSHPWHIPDQYGFVLADVEALPFQPLGGALGFFSVAGRVRDGARP